MLKTTLILTAISLSGLANAHAGDAVSFRYAAHELKTPGGAEALYERINDRARSACRTHSRDLEAMNFERVCTEKLRDELVSQIDHPRLSRLHQQTRGAVHIAQD